MEFLVLLINPTPYAFLKIDNKFLVCSSVYATVFVERRQNLPRTQAQVSSGYREACTVQDKRRKHFKQLGINQLV